MPDPFTPPSARVADGPAKKGAPVKAVVLGLLVDLGGTTVVSMAISILYSAGLASTGATKEEITAAMNNIPVDSWISIAGMAIGAMFSVLGGYVCARTARHSEFGLGAILAAFSIAFGLLMRAGQASFLLTIVISVVTFLAVMYGVRLGVARNASA